MRSTNKIIKKNKFVSLTEAKELGNQVKAKQAWVFNPHAVKLPNTDVRNSKETEEANRQKAKAFHEAAQAARNNPEQFPKCWELQPLTRFANNEQLQHLIDSKQFYYAPELKNLEDAKLKANYKAV